ncbi:hypothetical protein AQ490_08760 [Wenjunlia vitaminophila]|uniref:M23ase beta-sheet core domain-containing protein n=1 Tax=Wenjunlia vitaminophila TaxID=76728 RepID=A0A0T6LLB8_WENVI|nr:hypothetical protein AQ490_08760 [Wenjunlia vitaminophila]
MPGDGSTTTGYAQDLSSFGTAFHQGADFGHGYAVHPDQTPGYDTGAHLGYPTADHDPSGYADFGHTGQALPGQDPFGQDPFGQGPFDQDPLGYDALGQSHFGQDQFGQGTFGGNALGHGSFPADAFGQDAPGHSRSEQEAFGYGAGGYPADAHGLGAQGHDGGYTAVGHGYGQDFPTGQVDAFPTEYPYPGGLPTDPLVHGGWGADDLATSNEVTAHHFAADPQPPYAAYAQVPDSGRRGAPDLDTDFGPDPGAGDPSSSVPEQDGLPGAEPSPGTDRPRSRRTEPATRESGHPEEDAPPAGGRDEERIAALRDRDGTTARSRRRRGVRRSALLTVAVPSVCVVGVAGVAAATVVTTSSDKGSSTQQDTAAKPMAKTPPSKLDSQLTNLSAGAEDFAGRASRTQERIDLKERQALERKRKEAEAARKEAMRPKFVLPVAARGLSASYGQSGINWMSLHTGIDFPVGMGTSVMAATDGTVRTQWNDAYGNMAIVTAPDGTETWYCHLSSTRIRSGSVKAGDVIAYSGNTGKSTGPHLHFEVRPAGGSPIDPVQWLLSKGLDPR